MERIARLCMASFAWCQSLFVGFLVGALAIDALSNIVTGHWRPGLVGFMVSAGMLGMFLWAKQCIERGQTICPYPHYSVHMVEAIVHPEYGIALHDVITNNDFPLEPGDLFHMAIPLPSTHEDSPYAP